MWVLGSARDVAEALLRERGAEGLRVRDDLLGVRRETRQRGLLERDGLGGDRVFERSALLTGEDGRIDLLGVLLSTEDRAARGPRSVLCVVKATTSA